MSNVNQPQAYREVQRKANAGERIKIVNTRDSRYENGEVFVVETSSSDGVYVKHPKGRNNGRMGVWRDEYVVLEPIVAPAPLTATLPDLFAQFIRDNAGAVRSYLAEIDPVVSAEVNVEVTQSLTRAKVIEMARGRVAELELIGRKTLEDLPKGTPFHDRFYRIEFHVNRDKRTVTALARTGSYPSGKKPDAVGIAKAAPDDIFNADIGKAIAAERALGLALTDAFVNAPKPEQAVNYARVIYDEVLYTITPGESVEGRHGTEEAQSTSQVARMGRVIDDTDADYTQEEGAKDGEAA